jgi:deazaflavin-dependent oxidoreductase (nitroreductase family)
MPTTKIIESKKGKGGVRTGSTGSNISDEGVGKEQGRTVPKALPHVPRIIPVLNNVTRTLLRLGIPMGPMTLLRVRGRKTGKMHRQPIGFFKYNGHQYLFSTFGETNWVRNIRAVRGKVSVGTGWKQRAVLARELTPAEAAPVIKQAVAPSLSNPFAKMILGSHLAVALDAPIEEFASEAERHPVFELQEPKEWSIRGEEIRGE